MQTKQKTSKTMKAAGGISGFDSAAMGRLADPGQPRRVTGTCGGNAVADAW
jgi:hypothetical protein